MNNNKVLTLAQQMRLERSAPNAEQIEAARLAREAHGKAVWEAHKAKIDAILRASGCPALATK